MPTFGANSLRHLQTCHPNLQMIAREAIKHYDFSVVQGHRTQEEQDRAVAGGFSKLRWPNSMHNKVPSLAMDCYPWHPKYRSLTDTDTCISVIARVNNLDSKNMFTREKIRGFIKEEYARMGQTLLLCATNLGFKLRWGRDWNGDEDIFDHSFLDYPHFELVGVE